MILEEILDGEMAGSARRFTLFRLAVVSTLSPRALRVGLA